MTKLKQTAAYILNMSMALQLIISPVAFAQTTPPATTPAPATTDKKTGWDKVADVATIAIGLGSTAVQSFQNASYLSGGMLTPDAAALKANMQEGPDEYFTSVRMSKIPGLISYLQDTGKNPAAMNCLTLPTTLNKVRSPVCEIGKPNPPDAILQNYINAYSDTEKIYESYGEPQSLQGGTLFGVSCMNNAYKLLDEYFKFRKRELTNTIANIEALTKDLKAKVKADQDAVEESAALLYGGSGEIATKVKDKKPELFDFAKQFNDPACKSMFAGEEFRKNGGAGGLSSIETKIKETVETPGNPSADQGKSFSAESYGQGHAEITADIKDMIAGIAKNAETDFAIYASGAKSVGDLKSSGTSKYGVEAALAKDNSAFKKIQDEFTNENIKLQTQLAEVSAELGSQSISTDEAKRLVSNFNMGTFDQEMVKIENTIQNRCVRQSSQIDMVISKMVNPQLSSLGNNSAPSFIKDKLKQIISSDTSSEKKLQELAAIEKQGGSRYYVKLDSSYEVQEVVNGEIKKTVISPSSKKTPASFLADVISNCTAQFKTNNLDKKYSGASAIKKLKELRSSYKALSTKNSANIRNELTKKLLTCDTNTAANQSNSGSCTPGSFDMSSPGFCTNAALSCSKNMVACKTKAESMVAGVKTTMKGAKERYTATMKISKAAIDDLYAKALTKFKVEGYQLGAGFNVPWESPLDLQTEIPEGEKYIRGLKDMGSEADGKIQLEDPDAYVKMLTSNVKKLQESIEKQSNDVLDPIRKHIDTTQGIMEKNKGLAAAELAKCEAKDKDINAQSNKQADEFAKMMGQLGEVCENSPNSSSPLDVCNATGELSKETLGAVAKLGKSDAKKVAIEIKNTCAQYNKHAEASGDAEVKSLKTLCGIKDFNTKNKTICDPKNNSVDKICSTVNKLDTKGVKDEGYVLCWVESGKINEKKEVVSHQSSCADISLNQIMKEEDLATARNAIKSEKNCNKASAVPDGAQEAIASYYSAKLATMGQKLAAQCGSTSNASGAKSILDPINQAIQSGIQQVQKK